MTWRDDDALLFELAAALRGAPATPSDIDVAAFRRAIVDARSEATIDRAMNPTIRTLRGRSAVAVAVATVSLALGAGVAAAASGASLPTALRGPVRSLGIEVDSPALASARQSVAEVRRTLAASDTEALREDVAELRRRLDQLSNADRRRIWLSGEAVLADAYRWLGAHSPTEAATNRTAPGVAPAPAPAAPGSRGPLAPFATLSTGTGTGTGTHAVTNDHGGHGPRLTAPQSTTAASGQGDQDGGQDGGGQMGVSVGSSDHGGGDGANSAASSPTASALMTIGPSNNHGDGSSGHEGSASVGGQSGDNQSSGKK